MKALGLLIGVGVLTAVGVGVANAMSKQKSTVTLNHGAAYRFYIYPGFNGEKDDIEGMGFQSVNINPVQNSDTSYTVQALWGGPDGTEFTPPHHMTYPEFLGYARASVGNRVNVPTNVLNLNLNPLPPGTKLVPEGQ